MRLDPPRSWFLARRTAEGFHTEGTPEARLGYPIAIPGRDKPAGIFARWRWHGDTLEIENDRYGFYPLYYAAGPDYIAVSPSFPKLLEVVRPAEIDDRALAVFLHIGFYLGESTPFRAIKAIPPDATFRWQNGRLTVQDRRVVAPPNTYTRAQIIDAYIDLFRQSMRRHTPPDGHNIGVPLSGGRDSRHILLELVASGRKPDLCVTADDFACWRRDEASAASQVAAALAIPHVIVQQPASYVGAEVQRFHATRYLSDEHVLFLPVARCLADRVKCSYDGIAGGIFSAGAFQSEEKVDLLHAGRGLEFAHSVMRRGIHRMLAAGWRNRLTREIAAEEIAAEALRYRDTPNPVANFYFWNRTRREIALSPYGVMAEIPYVFTPYLDPDLYDFLSGLPASTVLDRHLHTDVIAKAFPSYADIPYAESGRVPNFRVPWRLSRAMGELLAYGAPRRWSGILDPAYMWPRLLRGILDPRYAAEFFGQVTIAMYFLLFADVVEQQGNHEGHEG